ncbi:Type III pantothenate kinase [Gossypium arboreum]|uniref:Type III pantothenate kinase n=1 Tax=Gossypium arboreum TaxID=29729 RepID=A0A0B0PQ91_GOSAR|nr:Type III pantothenate kinase [Gossypium arboreum]
MVVEEEGCLKGGDKHFNSRLSFKEMLLGASRDPKLSLQDQDKDDSQLIEGDVSTRIEDGLPSIRFSERVHQILYQSFPDFFIGRVDLTSIGEMIVHVIKLDDNTGNAQRGRFVRRYGRSCDSCSFVSAQDGQNDILTDSRDLNQGDNRESNPTVSAKLKGKKVAIYNNSLVEEGSPLKPQLGYASALARSSREGIKEAGPGNGQAATGFDLDGPSFTAGHRISNLGMIVGPSNVDYGPTISNGSHGALIANTATSNSNSSLPKSTHFLADLPVSPTKNLPSRINVISKQEVILENNCAQAIKGIHGGFKGQANRDLKLLIQELGIPDWQVVIKNILKEANFAPHILVGGMCKSKLKLKLAYLSTFLLKELSVEVSDIKGNLVNLHDYVLN